MPEQARRYRGETLEQRRSDQRLRMIEAARDVFAARGFQAASVEDVVRRARVSRTSFYRCFENKEDCLLAVLLAGTERLGGALDVVRVSEADPADKLTAGVEVVMASFAADPAMARVMLIEAVGASRAIEQARTAARSAFAALLEQEMRRFPGWHGFADEEVSLAAMGTMAAIAETVTDLVATGRLDDWERVVEPLRRFALRALAPPEALAQG